MLPIKYEVVGEEDYAFKVEILSNGEYVVQSETYTSPIGSMSIVQDGGIRT